MSNIKQAFVSRFPGGSIVEVDWNQLEVVILANLAQEKNLADSLNAGLDLHSVTASAILGVDYHTFQSRIISGDTTAKHIRKRAKAATFALQYGAGITRISSITGWSEAEAVNFRDTYYRLYPNILKYYNSVEEEVRSTSRPVNKNGEVWYYGQYTGPQGRRWVFSTNTVKYGKPNFSHTQMRNYPIQGTASDFVTFMLVYLTNEFDENILPVNTIHDSVVFDVNKGYLTRLEKKLYDVYGDSKYYMRTLFNHNIDILTRPTYTVKEGSDWSLT